MNYKNEINVLRIRSHQQDYKLFIKWNQDWTLHEAIDNQIIRLEFPEKYLSDAEDMVFSINGENVVFLSDTLRVIGSCHL